MSRARLVSGLLQGAGGDFQAQIDDLVAELATLVATVGVNTDTLASHTASLASLLSTVNGNSASITSILGYINTLQQRPNIFTNTSDNYGSVPIGNGSQYPWYTLNHYDIGNVVNGTKFLVIGQGQVRENLSFTVECLPALTWTAPGGSLADDGTGHNWFGFQAVGRNTNQDDAHYFDWCRVGVLEFTASLTSVRLHNRVRCKSGDADGSLSQLMTVGIGQGGISALRLGYL